MDDYNRFTRALWGAAYVLLFPCPQLRYTDRTEL